MARTHFTTLLFALALPCAANTITYTTNAQFAGDPIGRHYDVSGNLVVPVFDPALGTLDSIDFRITPGGGARFQIISLDPNHPLWVESSVSTVYSFLGVSTTHTEGGIFTTVASSAAACGGAYGGQPIPGSLHGSPAGLVYEYYPVTCDGQIGAIGLTDGGFYTFGTIANGTSSLDRYATAGGGPIAGALPTDLAPFIGAGQLLLPVSLSVDAYPTNFGDRMVIGDFLDPQRAGAFLNWTYNYTPAEAPALTAAPEPRYGFALAALLLAISRAYSWRGGRVARRC